MDNPTGPAGSAPDQAAHEPEGDTASGGVGRCSNRNPKQAVVRGVRRGLVLGVLVILLVFGTTTSPYARPTPGPVVPITVQQADAEVGDYAFLTVKLDQLKWWEWAFRKAQGDGSLRQVIADNNDPGGLRDMQEAKELAWQLAVTRTGEGDCGPVRIADMLEGSPAQTVGLQVGDVLVGTNATRFRCAVDVVDAVKASAGEPVELTVDRDGNVFDVTVTPTLLDGQWRIGVTKWVGNEPGFDVDTRNVGGSSAGLMLTLAYIDALQPGDLSAGREVTGTGTITADGTVEPIGGIEMKLRAAEQAGADVFFSPLEQAAGLASDVVTIVPVGSLDDAVAWLCRAAVNVAVCTTNG